MLADTKKGLVMAILARFIYFFFLWQEKVWNNEKSYEVVCFFLFFINVSMFFLSFYFFNTRLFYVSHFTALFE